MKIVIGIIVALFVLTMWSVCKVSDTYNEWKDGNFDDWQNN